MYDTERKIDIRIVLAVLAVALILACLGYGAYLMIKSRISSQENAALQDTPSLTAASSEDVTPFVPVSTITTLIKPCMFVFLDSCAKQVESNIAVDINPTVDPSANNGPEAQAQSDLFAALGSTPNRGLATYDAPINKDLVPIYFPEYAKDASASAVSVPAPQAIARVAAKFDINQRVLLVLMETVQNGVGPLYASTTDYSTPYFTNDAGFFSQLVTVAQSLSAERAKFALMQKEEGLPTSLKFFDKTYSVPDANIETLALVDFLGQKMQSKKTFEQAIYAPPVDGSSKMNPAQNFDLLYKVIFGVDPR